MQEFYHIRDVRLLVLISNKYFDYLKWSHNKVWFFTSTGGPMDNSAFCSAALFSV